MRTRPGLLPPRRALWRLLRAEARAAGSRWLLFGACIGLGVAAVVALDGLAAGLDRGVGREARRLLAADLVVGGQAPLPDDLALTVETALGDAAYRRADTVELLTLVSAAGDAGPASSSLLVELKAVDPGYPFYGRVETAPARPLADLLAEGVVAAPELLRRLDLSVGDPLRVGRSTLPIVGTVLDEPDRVTNSFALGPRVLLARSRLADTGTLGFGARASFRALLQIPGADDERLAEIKASLDRQLGDSLLRVRTYRDAQSSVRRGLDQLTRFLGMVALLAMLLGGAGVAHAVRLWLRQRVDAVATLRCLGIEPRAALLLFLLLATLFAAAGTIFGIVGGMLVPILVPRLAPQALPVELVDPIRPAALLEGLALGVGTCLLFAIPALSSLVSTSPARVFREAVEPLPGTARRAAWSLVLGLLLLLALTLPVTGSPRLSLAFVAFVGITSGLLALAFRGLASWIRRLPRGRLRPVAVRYGVATLARPGFAAAASAVALGLATLVVFTALLVAGRLEQRLDADLPDDAPTAFFLDVQRDQWQPLDALLADAGASRADSVPVVVGRVAAINGESAADLAETRRGEERWALTREQRLTYLETLPEDNEIVAGALWSDPEAWEVSVEEEFADEMGVGLGDSVAFDIQGVQVSLRVTSIRRVDWQTFGINFFLVAEPGALDAAPQIRLAAARLDDTAEQEVQDRVAAAFPNVTMLRVRQILERVRDVFQRLRTAIRLLGLFLAASALVVIVSTGLASAADREDEVALLEILGMGPRRVLLAFGTEAFLLSTCATLLGAAGAVGLAWWICTRELEVGWQMPDASLLLAALAVVAASTVAALAGNLRALRQRPLALLRRTDL